MSRLWGKGIASLLCPPAFPRVPPPVRCLGDDGPVPLSSLRRTAAPTDSCLGGDPGQAQVEDNAPNVQHAADLRGTEGTWPSGH